MDVLTKEQRRKNMQSIKSKDTSIELALTLNTYTHLGLEDAVDELKRVEELENARKEMEKINGEGTVSQKMFRAI